MTNPDDSTNKHPSVRHRSGEYTDRDAIDEILSSQRRMQTQINEINVRLSAGDHAIGTVESLTQENKDLRDMVIVMRTQMGGILAIASIFGVCSIGALVTSIMSLLTKAHP